MSKEEIAESNASSRESSAASEDQTPVGRSSSSKKKTTKASKPRLTASQKNFNHKDAENKRRTAIRERFTELSHMVPGAEGHERSEQVMLGKTTEFLKDMIIEQRRLEKIADEQGIRLDDGRRLRDDDYGGSQWRALNMDQYEAGKQKRGSASEQNDKQENEEDD